MASFSCPMVELTIKPHDNADKLSIAVIEDYECVVLKDEYKTGDKAIYIPEQAILPVELIQKMGLEGRLAGSKRNRVKATKLRGVLSQGLIVPLSFLPNQKDYSSGYDCQEELGIIKHEPVIPANMYGDVWFAGPERTLAFDIENLKKFPKAFEEGEEVVFTEKLHGTFCEISVSPTDLYDEKESPDGILVASKGRADANCGIKYPIAPAPTTFIHEIKVFGLKIVRSIILFFVPLIQLLFPNNKLFPSRRKGRNGEVPSLKKRVYKVYAAKIKRTYPSGRNVNNLYWRAAKTFVVGNKIKRVFLEELKTVPVFVLGEIYGAGVQDLDYGANSGVNETLGFRVFDVYVGVPGHKGRYLNDSELDDVCKKLELERVPILYRGPYSKEAVKKYTVGKETVSGRNRHIREGIVICPVVERMDRKYNKLGRTKLKSVSEKYLFRKGNVTEYN